MPQKDTLARRVYMREYKRRNRARLRSMNADGDRARNANKRAEKYSAAGRITIEDVRAVLSAGACHYCGNSEGLGIDHVQPLHLGGLNDPSNLVPCCHSCNASKGRSDRPRRWSWRHDCCQGCSTTERKHVAQGYCNACYLARKSAKA